MTVTSFIISKSIEPAIDYFDPKKTGTLGSRAIYLVSSAVFFIPLTLDFAYAILTGAFALSFSLAQSQRCFNHFFTMGSTLSTTHCIIPLNALWSFIAPSTKAEEPSQNFFSNEPLQKRMKCANEYLQQKEFFSRVVLSRLQYLLLEKDIVATNVAEFCKGIFYFPCTLWNRGQDNHQNLVSYSCLQVPFTLPLNLILCMILAANPWLYADTSAKRPLSF